MSYDSRPETIKHIRYVQDFMSKAVRNLLHRATVHDQSKLESPEKEVFDEYTPTLARLTFGSPEYRSTMAAMKLAIDHHNAVNSHHPEHYRWRCGVCDRRCTEAEWEVAPQGPNDSGLRYCPDCCRHGMIYEAYLKAETDKGLHGMSLLDLIEMLCDWKAATLRHDDGDIRKSIDICQKRFGFSNELRRIFENTIKELGFDAAPGRKAEG